MRQHPTSSSEPSRASSRAAVPLSLLSKISDIATRFSERIWAAQGTRPPTFVLRDDCRDAQGRPQLEPQDGPLKKTTVQRRASRVITPGTRTNATTEPTTANTPVRRGTVCATSTDSPSTPLSPGCTAAAVDTRSSTNAGHKDILPPVRVGGRRRSRSVGQSPPESPATGSPAATAGATGARDVRHVRSWSPVHTNLPVQSPTPQPQRRESLRSASSGSTNASAFQRSHATATPATSEGDSFPLSPTDSDLPAQDSSFRADAAPPTPLFTRRRLPDVGVGEIDACEKSLDERQLEALGDAPLTKNIATRQDYKRELTRIRRLSYVSQNQWESEIRQMREQLTRLETYRRRSSCVSPEGRRVSLSTPAGTADVVDGLFASQASSTEARRRPSALNFARGTSASEPPTPLDDCMSPLSPNCTLKTPQPRRPSSGRETAGEQKPFLDSTQWRTSQLMERSSIKALSHGSNADSAGAN